MLDISGGGAGQAPKVSLADYVKQLNNTASVIQQGIDTPTPVTRVGENGGTAPITNWQPESVATPRELNPLGGPYDTPNNGSAASGSPAGSGENPQNGSGGDNTGTGGTGGGNGGGGSGTGTGSGSGTGAGLTPEQLAAQRQAEADQAAKTAAGQSAFDLLYAEFSKYGLGALVEPLRSEIVKGTTGAALTLALQNTKAYQDRFSANAERISKGLAALKPADYIALEDQYQNVMRQYGLPASYYTPGQYGKQSGFDQLIANDVSNVELEDRIATAQNRVLNANPDVLKTLKQFYPNITNGDILAYALDPKNALTALKQKVTASEIGAAAFGAGLASGQTPEQIANYAANAEMLQRYGVTGQQAQQNFGQIASLAQRGSQLADIYGQQPYGQQQAQAEVFNLAGQTDAANQRKKLTALEQAQFGGQSGTASNAFSRERQMSPMMLGVPGAGAF